MNIADEIKYRIKMTDIFERYGYEPNRGGFISCPFHSEKTASLRAYAEDTRFKCFGCGASGDVISFVMQLYGISFGQAIIRMDSDFRMGLTNEQPDRREAKRISANLLRHEQKERKNKFYISVLSEYHRRLWLDFLTKRPKSHDEPLSSEFIHALHELDDIEYRIEEMQKEMR